MPTFMNALLASLLLFAGGFLGLPQTARADETLYLSRQSDLVDSSGGVPLATVAPGTALKVLARKGGMVRVGITGWSPEGGESYMFNAIGQRITLARLTDAGVGAKTDLAQQEDDYESVWYNTQITGWLPQSVVVSDVAKIWEAGSALFHQRCTRCHALHRPAEFTANQWPSILKIMTVRAGLSGADKALVVQYLQTHAKDGPAAGDKTAAAPDAEDIAGTPALARQGAVLYRKFGCAGCHGDDAATPADPLFPALAGQSAGYILKQLDDFKSGTRSNDQDEVMRSLVADLSSDDSKALAYWLSTARK